MRANLILENIGSHRGKREYEINSGKITIFEGSNSSGKTTIIKSIATILSCPIKSDNLKLEANNFGILPLNNKESPIVNIFETKAKISLLYKDLVLNAALLKDGTINTDFQGNENFLYACMLLKNSKIQRNLASGDDNFQWIVSEMSYAGSYEQINEINNSYIRLINAAKNTLKDVNKKIGKYIDENKDLENKKKNLSLQLSKIQEEIEKLPPSKNPELKILLEQKSNLSNNMETSHKRLKTYEKKKNDKQKVLEKISSDIEDIDSEVDKLKNNSESLRKEIEEIKKIDPDVEYENIMLKQEILKEVIGNLSIQKFLRDLNNTILNARYESDTCPICNSKITMKKETFSTKLKEIRKKIDELTKERFAIEQAIETSDNLIKRKKSLPSSKENQLKNINREIGIKQGKKDENDKQINIIQADLKNIEEENIREKKKVNQNQEKLEDVQKKIEIIRSKDKENSELYQDEKKILANIKNIEINIEKNYALIKDSSEIEIFGNKIPIEKADYIVDSLSNEFEKIEIYLNERISEQRTGAGKKFNSTIKRVIKELNLEDFEDIYIDLEDYRLVVLRKGGKIQPLGALGGAERGIIGGILQVSCKQTYLKEIPFFIGDDIILEFDPDMSEIFVNYLKKLAIDDDLFIIITKISNNRELKQLEI